MAITTRRAGTLAAGLTFFAVAVQALLAQPPSPPAEPATASRQTNDGRYESSLGPGLGFGCGDELVVPIDLPTALRLAQLQNYDILQAREVVNQFQAVLLRARVLWLPSATLGATYLNHQGQIQRADGDIITVNRDALGVGGGPTVSFQLVEAIFAPLIQRAVLEATRAGLQRVNNDTMLAVADAYFAVLRARRRLARVEEVLDFLASDRPSEARAKSKGLLPLIRDIVEAGGKEAFPSDLERVRVEVFRRREEGVQVIQDYRIAAAELARLLRLDPTILLCPVEDFRFPVPLPGDEWASRSAPELAEFALYTRPETAENRALVEAALRRLQTAKWRPLLPSPSTTLGWGGFGGGPLTEIDPFTGAEFKTQSGVIKRFDTRMDYDASLVWRLQNLGLGNAAEIREQKALHCRAIWRQLQVHDQIITQVVQAQAQTNLGLERFEITRQSLFDEAGRPTGAVFLSLRLNFDRVRGAEGRPLEVQDSIRGLNDQLETYANSLTEYDRGRFRLLVALGVPPYQLNGSALETACGCRPTGAMGPYRPPPPVENPKSEIRNPK